MSGESAASRKPPASPGANGGLRKHKTRTPTRNSSDAKCNILFEGDSCHENSLDVFKLTRLDPQFDRGICSKRDRKSRKEFRGDRYRLCFRGASAIQRSRI